MQNEAFFRDKPVWKAIFALALPSVLTILILVIYNIADLFFIGMLGDDTQVAAVAVVGPVFSLATAVSTMLGAGGCAVMANALGGGDTEKARLCGTQCIWAALLFGALFSIVILAATKPILGFLGATDDLTDSAGRYMRILALGSPFMLFSMAAASIVRAEGAVIPGVVSNMTGTVINLILDPLFILGLGMGVAGAAIATVLGNIAAALLLTRFIVKRSSVLVFSPRAAMKRPSLLAHTMAVGLPNGASSMLSGLASTFGNQLLSLYGSSAIAAMAAAGRATMVITMVQMGICMGVSPLLAYNYGAKNLPRIKEVLRNVTILTVGFGLAATIACLLSGDAVIGLFLEDAGNAETAKTLMRYLLIASPLLGLYYLSSNFLQAAGNALSATIVSVLRQGALLIPCLYLMHHLMGLTGIAIAHMVSDLAAIAVSAIFCMRQYRKLKRTALCTQEAAAP